MSRAEEFAKKEGFLAGPVHNTIVRAYEQAEKDFMEKAGKWLRDIYSQFDITDTAGYAIDIDTMVRKFKQAMSE